MASSIVIYDASVLYPAPLRDFLMWLALTDLFKARWTNEIHGEWTRNVLKNRPDITPEQLARTRALMDANVRDCLVVGYEPLIPALELPDPDDRHVLAAAIHCGAEFIVTFNLKDFPSEILTPQGVEAIHPDDFILDLIESDAAAVVESARKQRATLKNPPLTAEKYVEIMIKQGLPRSMAILRDSLKD
ncbi:PIN domain-containing protein [Pannus brasiliensis CCIBt3594]|uniref:PIN domain-containing protein n=1 Tax=Pannus brasiliensis CCIBt3594 TaxID=1427578 RepID=A0AAW9QW21_9CHRO